MNEPRPNPHSRPVSPASEPSASGAVLVPNPGIWRIPHLGAFLPEFESIVRAPIALSSVRAVAGWGYKKPSRYARALARKLGRPYLCLEDGFLRSVGTGAHGAPPLSLTADFLGAYYDAAGPSDLENVIAGNADPGPAVCDAAREMMSFKASRRLSKYNRGAPLGPDRLPATTRERVLVLDQVAGDASIAGAGADASTFESMLTAARNEYPRAQLILKRHPAAGAHGSPIPNAQLAHADVVVAEDVDLIDLILRCDHVYTVSSLGGLEALLCGRPVTCFGAAFYAGWGLTDDRFASISRRSARPSLAALFAAVYMTYPRYVDPLNGARCDLRTAMLRLAGFRDHAHRFRGAWVVTGLAPAKHSVVRRFLGGPCSTVRFQADVSSQQSKTGLTERVRLATWASRPPPRLVQSGSRYVKIEDGFIRSAGLGSSFYPASSLVFDEDGIYYDSTRTSDLERLLSETIFDAELCARARRFAKAYVDRGLSKYNLRQSAELDLSAAKDRSRILVPGQVEDDASVRTAGGGMTNLALLQAVRAAQPQAFIVYKEHPDVLAGNRQGRILAKDGLRFADLVVTDVDIRACIRACDSIHTLTSLTGFEALLQGKSVTTYGAPFYAGWGLTHDMSPPPRRTRVLSLDELVAGALLLYPTYLDPISGLPVDPETYLDRLDAARARMSGSGLTRRPLGPILRMVRGVASSLTVGRSPQY